MQTTLADLLPSGVLASLRSQEQVPELEISRDPHRPRIVRGLVKRIGIFLRENKVRQHPPYVLPHQLRSLLDSVSICRQLRGIVDRHPHLRDLVVHLTCLHRFWIRPLSHWTEPADPSVELARHLTDHLLCLYPIPEWVYGKLNAKVFKPWKPWVGVFLTLAQGGSLQALGREMSWLLPKGLQHLLLNPEAQLSFKEALQMARLQAMGCRGWSETPVLMSRFRMGNMVVSESEPARQYVSEVAKWLDQHGPLLDEEELDLVMDWLYHQFLELHYGQDHWEPVARRGPARILGLARAYRNGRYERHRYVQWQGSGWDWEKNEGEFKGWSVVELCDTDALRAEGIALWHCVGSYGAYCVRGISRIFSLRFQGRSRVTIELDPKGKIVRQAKGYGNREGSAMERALIRQWLSHIA